MAPHRGLSPAATVRNLVRALLLWLFFHQNCGSRLTRIQRRRSIMTKFNRNIDGFLPGHILLEMALRNPEMVSLTRTLFRTQELWAHSAARGNQLFRFLDTGKGD